MIKEEIRKELDQYAPSLRRPPSDERQGFRVPEGYFDTLPDRVLARHKGRHSDHKPLGPYAGGMARRLGLPPWRMAALAASLALVLVAAIWAVWGTGNQSFLKTGDLAGMEQFSEEQVLAYLDQQMDGLDWDLLIDAGILTPEDVDYANLSELSEEEKEWYLDAILEQ